MDDIRCKFCSIDTQINQHGDSFCVLSVATILGGKGTMSLKCDGMDDKKACPFWRK